MPVLTAPATIKRANSGSSSRIDVSALANRGEKFFVVANVIGGVVWVRGEHKERRIACVFVLRRPNHRRYIQPAVRSIEHDFEPILPVIDDDRAGSHDANEKLRALAMGVRAARLAGRH